MYCNIAYNCTICVNIHSRHASKPVYEIIDVHIQITNTILQVSESYARYGLPFVYLPSRHITKAFLSDNALGPARLCGVTQR